MQRLSPVDLWIDCALGCLRNSYCCFPASAVYYGKALQQPGAAEGLVLLYLWQLACMFHTQDRKLPALQIAEFDKKATTTVQ